MKRVIELSVPKKITITAVLMALLVIAVPGVLSLSMDSAENIAPSTVVDGEVANESYSVDKLIDGKYDNYYTGSTTSDEETTKELSFTFDQRYRVSEVTLYPYLNNGSYKTGFPKDFTISVKQGEDWTEVARKTGVEGSDSPMTVSFDAIEGTALKLTVTKLGPSGIRRSPYILQLAEVEIMGIIPEKAPNIARSATVTAQIPNWAAGSMGAGKINDGIPNNRSCSSMKTTENVHTEVYLTFDKTYEINEIAIYPYIASGVAAYGFPKDFTLSVWTGTEWLQVAERTGIDNPMTPEMCTFEAVEARAVKLDVTKFGLSDDRNNPYVLHIGEIEVYGVEASGEISVPEITPPTTEEIQPGTEPEPELPPTEYGNIAAAAEIIAESPSWASTLSTDKLVDNIMFTRDNFYTSDFSAANNCIKNVYFTFEQAYKVNYVTLYPRVEPNGSYKYGFPEELTISLWDGSEWKTVATKTGIIASATEPLTISFEEQVCKGVLVSATKLGSTDNASRPFGLMLGEVKINGLASDATLVSPTVGDVSIEPPISPEPGVDPSTFGNIASLATITAQEPSWGVGKLGPDKMVDGIIKTRDNYYTTGFSAQQGAVKNVYFTYDIAYTVNEVTLYPRVEKDGSYKYGFPEDFTISLWNGNEWKTVAQKTGVKGDVNGMKITFEETICRGVMISATKLGPTDNTSSPFAFMLGEVMINGKASDATLTTPTVGDVSPEAGSTGGGLDTSKYGNIASLATITAQEPSWAVGVLGPDKMVDGIIKTRDNYYTTSFTAKQTDMKSVYFTYDTAFTVNEVTLYPRVEKDGSYKYGFPEDFTISLWTGKEWKTVAKKVGAKGDVNEMKFTFEETICRGVKITATKLGPTDNTSTPYALMFGEVIINGKASSAAVGNPQIGETTTPQKTIDNSRNIALNCPVNSKSDLPKSKAADENVNDGDVKTWFVSDWSQYKDGDTEWVEINLLKNYYIDTVILAARSKAEGFPYDFKISIYYDGEWQDVVVEKDFKADETAPTTLYEFKIKKTLGNKIRVSTDRFRMAGKDKSFCLMELAAYGTKAPANLPLANHNIMNRDVEVKATTSIEDFTLYLSNLYDGKLDTEWSSVPAAFENDEQVITVDLKREWSVGEIQMKPAWGGGGFPVDFEISVMENGKWFSVYRVTDYEKPINEAIQRFSFEPRRITQFRITVTKMASEASLYSVKLAELMAYPRATGDDFDLDVVDEVVNVKTYNSAETLGQSALTEKEVGIFDSISIAGLVSGIVMIVISIAGAIVLILVTSKKNKKMKEQY